MPIKKTNSKPAKIKKAKTDIVANVPALSEPRKTRVGAPRRNGSRNRTPRLRRTLQPDNAPLLDDETKPESFQTSSYND